ncbi:MAG: DUF2089 domain-containing protein [Planctomycetota bacterium]
MESVEMRCGRCGRPMDIVRYHCEGCDVALEGRFSPPPLARLSVEDQAFVTAFVRVHGNIKKVEGLFGVSYPTVKNRLNAIAGKLDAAFEAPADPSAVLERLERGQITVEQALEMLGGP